MRLYLFEHCSLCFRVRMTAALKHMHLQETVVLEDDSETMMSLVGKRAVPILITDDGQPMLESMDMVRYIDRLGDPVLTGPERPEIAAWAERVPPKAALLTWPRYPLLGLPEFATVAFTLDKGKFSEQPVKTQFGWHVILVEDKRKRPAPPFDQVKQQLERFVVRKAQMDLVTKLRAEAKIERMDKPAQPPAQAPQQPVQPPAPAPVQPQVKPK